MELVLATLRLDDPGGSETYAITLAGQLERLGHDVTLYARELGAMAEHARDSGLRVCDREQELPDRPDALIVQDGVLSYELAARYETAPQLFVAHTADFDLQRPPQVDGVVGAAVALNDRIARRLDTLGAVPRLVRLRQPVDLRRFVNHGPLPDRPSRVLVYSRYIGPQLLPLVERATDAAGLELTAIGAGRQTLTPETDFVDADIVIGSGRAVMEAMACGRAAYVLGRAGGDGWVTAETYAALESDGFSGMAFAEPVDSERLRDDLAGYRPEMGRVNRELIVRHHRAGEHAVELAELLTEITAARAPAERGQLRELGRMVRVQWNTDARASRLADEVAVIQAALNKARAEADQMRSEASRARWAEAELARLKRTRRYRLAAMLARPLDALRKRLAG